MKSRTSIILLVTFLGINSLLAQTSLTHALYDMRSGDKLIKQQIEYKDPGRLGENVIWNFSKLKTINEKYDVSYMEPVRKSYDTLFVTGVEHQTMYKYALTGDSLFMLGFENSGSQLKLTKPELTLVYPFSFGDSIFDTYTGIGRYLNILHSQAEGTITTVADATGTLILPDGDTLFNVLRVRSERCYVQRTLPIAYEEETRLCLTDTLEIVGDKDVIPKEASDNISADVSNDKPFGHLTGSFGMEGIGKSSMNDKDSQEMHSNGKTRHLSRGQMLKEKTDSIYFRTETFRWYAPGYRYPLFETICNKSHLTKKDNLESKDIATAFYFPPSMHTYLESDPKNKAIIDSLLAENKDKDISSSDSLLFDYNYFPNPVKNDLNVELFLDQRSYVTFRIVDTSGKIILTSMEGVLSAGTHDFTLRTNRLRFGNYVLQIIVGKQIAYALLLKI